MKKCPHAWRHYRDWEGDPSLPEGTHSWDVWTCLRCDEEVFKEPPEWESTPEPEEYLND